MHDDARQIQFAWDSARADYLERDSSGESVTLGFASCVAQDASGTSISRSVPYYDDIVEPKTQDFSAPRCRFPPVFMRVCASSTVSTLPRTALLKFPECISYTGSTGGTPCRDAH